MYYVGDKMPSAEIVTIRNVHIISYVISGLVCGFRAEHCNNSIKLNSLLFMCQVNSYKANYRHSTM
jgi:hypothetical protein